jgi:hypothetical protein
MPEVNFWLCDTLVVVVASEFVHIVCTCYGICYAPAIDRGLAWIKG